MIKNEYSIKDGVAYVDISTKKHPSKVMLVDERDWSNYLKNPNGRVYCKKCTRSKGTLYATVKGISFHRFIFPDSESVDHQNHDGLDNRRSNLLPTSQLLNMKNQRMHSSNTSGHTGIHFERGKWRARIGVNGTSINLGRHDNIEDALIARREAKAKYGFHANHS